MKVGIRHFEEVCADSFLGIASGEAMNVHLFKVVSIMAHISRDTYLVL